MTFYDFVALCRSDLYRYAGHTRWSTFLRYVLFQPGYKYSFLYRSCSYLHGKPILFPFYMVARLFHRHYTFRYGISIPYNTVIGAGLYIGHFGGIVINPAAKIGMNCNLSQGITIGQLNRGKRKGVPLIGNGVFIGPGAYVLGSIIIGNNCVIGANAVVIQDLPDNAVVGTPPAIILSLDGSDSYINRRWGTSIDAEMAPIP